ncbi:MAG: major capsid protein [Microvirus sp.]|nr:MAG: major capsid protein [Microvirus sp.]
MKSVMSHSFSQVPQATIPRSSFDRSHGVKTTFDGGYLVPFFVDEALPGDTFSLKANIFARLGTPIVPFMDNLRLTTFFFAVPNRLVWDNWQRFNGEQTDPDDTTDYEVPVMTSPNTTGYAVMSLSDYLGIPPEVSQLEHISLYHRAYNLIWNEWFRDQNLQDSVVVDKDNGPDTTTDYVVLQRGKRHDYFTSALPWPQKGPSVPLPLGTEAPIKGKDSYTGVTGNNIYVTNSTKLDSRNLVHDTVGGTGYVILSSSITPDPQAILWQQEGDFTPAPAGGTGYNYADLSDATASTINALRQAFQLQKLYERDARGGTRYTEIIRAHFGVVSPDARLQRPEYLGGSVSPINVTPVPQTSGTSASGTTTPLANLAAFGTVSQSGHGFTKSFTEHSLVIGLVCVDADLNYQRALNRMYSRNTRFDYYWPALSHIGEQAVLNKEIYAQGATVTTPLLSDNDVFGYQERYAEYRYKPSLINGKFRSDITGSLDIWHLAEDHDALPRLDDTFIVSNPPIDRVIATPTQPHFLMDAFIQLRCARPMPVYSVPGLIDHF